MKIQIILGLALVALTVGYVQRDREEELEDQEILENLENYIAERAFDVDDLSTDEDDDEDRRLTEVLDSLDERSVDLLLATFDSEDEPAQRSLLNEDGKQLVYSLLLADNPALREVLATDSNEEVSLQARGKLWDKIKKKIKEIWNKWRGRVFNWLKKYGKMFAKKICDGIKIKPAGMPRSKWIWVIKLIKNLACWYKNQ